MTTTPPPIDREAERQARADLIDLLMEDHRTITELLAVLATADLPAARRGGVAQVLVAELSRHTTVERRHLYPSVRQALADGDRLAAEADGWQTSLAELAARLAGTAPDDPQFGRVREELTACFARHAEAQEEELFARLREECGLDRLRELGWNARSTRETAPTRPHPRVPGGGVLRAVVDPLIGAADRVRDEVSGRPTDPTDLPE